MRVELNRAIVRRREIVPADHDKIRETVITTLYFCNPVSSRESACGSQRHEHGFSARIVKNDPLY
jgi:hypothetical protein